MKKWLSTYFDFSKREYNGLLVLIVLLMLVSLAPYFYQWISPDKSDVQADMRAISQLVLVEKKMKGRSYRPGKEMPSKLFRFDPNHASVTEWQLLGLSVKQAAVLMRYRQKGGKFHKKSDLKKMYPISQEMYERLFPYIMLASSDTLSPRKRAGFIPFVKAMPIITDLNTADTLALYTVRGIGPAFARRIVKYRERLGGFYKKEQLLEVYGLDSVKFSEIKNQLIINGSSLRLIYINKVDFETLKTHPYLNFKQINAIIQFRKQHGNYSNFAELKKVAILPPETIDKLAPYISFDHD